MVEPMNLSFYVLRFGSTHKYWIDAYVMPVDDIMNATWYKSKVQAIVAAKQWDDLEIIRLDVTQMEMV